LSNLPEDRRSLSSTPEDLFAELFVQVFGVENARLLAPQFPVEDIYGGSRYIDFALRTLDERVAFEIDGVTWHVPDPERIGLYEDDLLRQNSLIHQGWRVFRWTDRQISQDSDQVKEQLALFLERIPGLLSFDDFLPRQSGAVLELRPHQEEALQALEELRACGNTMALVTHAQGAGKTLTAITDARRLGGRTLFAVHTRDLVHQACKAFRKFWPEVTTGLFLDNVRDTETFNLVGTVQSLARHLERFGTEDFSYLIFDEAHHATSESYQKILRYFRPRFTLGLTATPDRADGLSALEVFRNTAHRLTLREAVERCELVPIRCVRVHTNVDLSRVRFNQIQYNRRDIEETVLVPSRDRLIVDTYRDHVPGRKAVVFCVNVRHGVELAERFRAHDIPARSVSGRLSARERQECLENYARGEIRVLCACDLLNEGWDCPDVEVLMMARPTLSKVIYLQQLGRGTRKAPGKECLIVFDFMDNASRYNSPLSLHRLVGQSRYKPGALVLAPSNLLEQEKEALTGGKTPTQVLPVELWTLDFQEIDVFNWQETVAGMVSTADLELELATAEGRIRSAVERGVIQSDHTLSLGDRTYHYFRRERAEEIRESLGLPRIDDESIRGLFLEFVKKMDMSSSYKPVLLLALLDGVDERGRARLEDVVLSFQTFYWDRYRAGLPVERSGMRMLEVERLSKDEVRAVMLGMPFAKFERRKYMSYDKKDLSFLRFHPRLWQQLTAEDFSTLRKCCEQAIADYYARFSS
jgi:superfamily II DNA or RNA helicase/very-short-patch-repair endonuclease